MMYDGFYGAYLDGELMAISNSRWHMIRFCHKHGFTLLPMLHRQFIEEVHKFEVP